MGRKNRNTPRHVFSKEAKKTLASRTDDEGNLIPIMYDEGLPNRLKKPFKRRSYGKYNSNYSKKS